MQGETRGTVEGAPKLACEVVAGQRCLKAIVPLRYTGCPSRESDEFRSVSRSISSFVEGVRPAARISRRACRRGAARPRVKFNGHFRRTFESHFRLRAARVGPEKRLATRERKEYKCCQAEPHFIF